MRHPSSIGTESIKVYPYVSNLLEKKKTNLMGSFSLNLMGPQTRRLKRDPQKFQHEAVSAVILTNTFELKRDWQTNNTYSLVVGHRDEQKKKGR